MPILRLPMPLSTSIKNIKNINEQILEATHRNVKATLEGKTSKPILKF